MKLQFSINSDRGLIPLNLYPSQDSEAQVFLRGTTGMVQFADTGSAGPIRGMFAKDSLLHVASGNQLYKVTESGTASLIGSLGSTTGPVWMTDNGFHLVVVDPPAMYLYDYATGLTAPVGDTDFPGASCCSFLDGYIVFAVPDSQQFYITAGYDAKSIDALDFASAEANPDQIVTLLVDHRELVLFGQRTTEFWYNSGNSDFPLERVQGSVMEIGCGAKASPASADNSVLWLDNRGLIVRADGYVPKVISTRRIEQEIASLPRSDDAVGFSYTWAGRTFYQITFPSGNKTYCYDISTDTWHQRGYTENIHASLASCYAHFQGRHIVGSRVDGRIFELSPDVYTDDGQVITRQFEASLIDGQDRHVSIAKLFLDMEVGMGNPVDPGTDPQVSMTYSNDDGKTWSSELWCSYGMIGEYQARAVFHRLGAGRKRRFRFTVTDPNPVTIWGVQAQIRGVQG